MSKKRPSIDLEICSCCGACANKCPVSVIKMDVKRRRNMCLSIYPRLADDDGCIGCSICAKACPVEAITMFSYEENGVSKAVELQYVPYTIIDENCKGCTVCTRVCPVGAISGKLKEVHIIDEESCVECGMCFDKCKFSAITRIGLEK